MHGNKLNLEDNSEEVKIGKAIHEEKDINNNTEVAIENIKLDKITSKYLTEVKKSDSDIDAAKWQLIYYLKVLKDKGINRKGKLEFVEKKKGQKKVIEIDLDEDIEKQLEEYIKEINNLILGEKVPDRLNTNTCKKCAYYEYCYI